MYQKILEHRIVIKTKPLIYAVFFTVFLFQDPLSSIYSGFDFLDEITAILLGFYYFVYIFRNKAPKNDLKTWICVLSLIVIGFLGNAYSGVQNNLLYQLFDAFNIFKFLLAILGGCIFFERVKDKDLIIHYLAVIAKITVLISTIFMIYNLFEDIGMHTDFRYGIRTFNFIFTRVGDFYEVCILWLIILTGEMYYRRTKNNYLFIALVLLNMCSTLRTRAIAFAVFFIILYFAMIVMKNKKFKIWYIPPLSVAIYFIARDQFAFYFTGDRARNILLRYGIITAQNYFPIGSGFATYGTAMAQRSYSQLYHEYNFSQYWGLSTDFGGFLTDNYWPAIMAQFGFFGMIIMAILLFFATRKMLRLTDNIYSRLCAVFAFGTLYFSSLASSSFFACTRLIVFTCIVLQLVRKRPVNEEI